MNDIELFIVMLAVATTVVLMPLFFEKRKK